MFTTVFCCCRFVLGAGADLLEAVVYLSGSRLHSRHNSLRLLHHRHSTLHPKTHETSATESSSRLVLKNTDNFTSQFSLKKCVKLPVFCVFRATAPCGADLLLRPPVSNARQFERTSRNVAKQPRLARWSAGVPHHVLSPPPRPTASRSTQPLHRLRQSKPPPHTHCHRP